jgi:hypothetical protein
MGNRPKSPTRLGEDPLFEGSPEKPGKTLTLPRHDIPSLSYFSITTQTTQSPNPI